MSKFWPVRQSGRTVWDFWVSCFRGTVSAGLLVLLSSLLFLACITGMMPCLPTMILDYEVILRMKMLDYKSGTERYKVSLCFWCLWSLAAYFQISHTWEKSKILTYWIFCCLGFYCYMQPNLIPADIVNVSRTKIYKGDSALVMKECRTNSRVISTQEWPSPKEWLLLQTFSITLRGDSIILSSSFSWDNPGNYKAFSSFTCFISVFFRLSFDFILILFLHVHGCSHMSVITRSPKHRVLFWVMAAAMFIVEESSSACKKQRSQCK